MVSGPLTDEQIWINYPHLRNFFNKLWFSDHLGYVCGPAGVGVPVSGLYVVRPIYNLDGMSYGVQYLHIEKGSDGGIEPGYFWCEKFEGDHYSVDFLDENPILTAIGEKDERPGYFKKWTRVNEHSHTLPTICRNLGIKTVNVEFINQYPIEVHFRLNEDFSGHDFYELVVDWEDSIDDLSMTHTYLSREEMTQKGLRRGFWAK